MNVERILNSQVAKLVTFSASGGGLVHAGRVAREISTRYDFMQGPQTVHDYDLERGITFSHGYSDAEFVVDRLVIFSKGILAEAKVNNALVSKFLDDLVVFAVQNLDVVVNQGPEIEVYRSTLEVKVAYDMGADLVVLNHINRWLEDKMETYGFQVTPYKGIGFMLGVEPVSAQSLRPGIFRLERREGFSWSDQMYYSEAPLRTDDHISLLESLEKPML